MRLQVTTACGVFIKGFGGQDGGFVVDSVGVMSFMNRNRRVYVLRLNSLFLDDWLNVVMNMVMRMFSFNHWGG